MDFEEKCNKLFEGCLGRKPMKRYVRIGGIDFTRPLREQFPVVEEPATDIVAAEPTAVTVAKTNTYKAALARRKEEQLLEQYMPVAQSFARRNEGRATYADILQVASIGVLEGIRTYDANRNVKLITHITNRANFAVSHYLRVDTGIVHIPYRVNIKRSDPLVAAKIPQRVYSDYVQVNEPVVPDTTANVSTTIILKNALSILSEQARKIMIMYSRGDNFKEIGAMLRLTAQKVAQLYENSVECMKRHLERMQITREVLVAT